MQAENVKREAEKRKKRLELSTEKAEQLFSLKSLKSARVRY